MASATLTPPAGAAAHAVARHRTVPKTLQVWRPDSFWRNWMWTLAVVGVGAFTRFWALGWPNEKVFDEVYYATEAQEMLRFGYEDNRDYMFIVHPPLGKWCIALGSWLWGDHGALWHTSPEWGYRSMPAVAGTITVLVTVRIAQRMLRSTLLGLLAGLLVSLDGISLVVARTALLDVFLEMFVLLGFAALLLDRDQVRGRLGALYEAGVDLTNHMPSLGPRPWRVVAGVMFGLALGVKWSAWSFWIGFSFLALFWEYGALKAAGADLPFFQSLKRGWPGGFFALGITAIGTYLLTWLGWFVGENSWNRHWGETHPGHGWFGWLPGGIRALLNYHAQAYHFHTHLTDPHAYKANPWGWLILARPISFYYPTNPTGCGAAQCSREILLIGTPIMYWAIVPMLLWALWRWITTRDWRAGTIVMAAVVGWAIWLNWQQRTAFLFYMAPLMPYLMIGLAMAVGAMLSVSAEDERSAALAPARTSPPPALTLSEDEDDVVREVGLREWIRLQAIPRSRLLRTAVVALWLGAVIADFVWMWPLYTGGLLTYQQWQDRMWFPSWI